MRPGWMGVALLTAGLVAGCTAPTPSPSEAAGGACAPDLPPRTSPTDYPLAVLYVSGEDLPPVVGEVDWRGGEEPVSTTAPLGVHIQRFTVLQVAAATEISIRMTDDVSIAEWHVDALPNQSFRAGDMDTGAELSSGDEPTDLVCVPVEEGAWVIRAELTFADDAGRGTYYWRVNVGDAPSG